MVKGRQECRERCVGECQAGVWWRGRQAAWGEAGKDEWGGVDRGVRGHQGFGGVWGEGQEYAGMWRRGKCVWEGLAGAQGRRQ